MRDLDGGLPFSICVTKTRRRSGSPIGDDDDDAGDAKDIKTPVIGPQMPELSFDERQIENRDSGMERPRNGNAG